MKIAGTIFRNKSVISNTPDEFDATYKGKHIVITTDHGFGAAREFGYRRFDITVRDIKTGMLDVNTYEDFETIGDAIQYALIGSMVI